MRGRNAFSDCHPALNFLFFALVIGFSMFLMHPVCLCVSLVCAVSFHVRLYGGRSAKFLLRGLPLFLMAALVNPAFNHQGVTVLCYLPTGNPLTLESILYGLAAAGMLAAVLLWFGCCTEVMTSDKFVYLFGRILPALSLVLSMALRFLPRCRAQLEVIRETRACLGRDRTRGRLFGRLRGALACFSALVTWALESSIETADSMKSRGYGLRGRTAFSIYTLTERDKALLLWFSFCGLYLLSGCLTGGLSFRYFPRIRGAMFEPMTVSFLLVYFALCATPTVLCLFEERKWRSLQSKT